MILNDQRNNILFIIGNYIDERDVWFLVQLIWVIVVGWSNWVGCRGGIGKYMYNRYVIYFC